MLVNKHQFSLCANRGSATAGGGKDDVGGKQFYFEFVKYLNVTGVISRATAAAAAAVDIIERGHGSRHSLHSALMAQSYFPPNLDIVLWEFAINDVGYLIQDPDVKRLEEKNALILWLEQVSRIKPHPPLVIFVYLWSAPFSMDNVTLTIDNPVFESHQRVAAEYDFVVGHVNLASYIEELGWGAHLSMKHFLADKRHPNTLGHGLVAYLLLQLVILDVDGDEQQQKQQHTLNSTTVTKSKTPFQWACGNDTEEQRLIQSRVVGKPTVASFTMELPKNEQAYPGMLVVQNNRAKDTLVFGKAKPGRKDRTLAVTLPCCQTNKKMLQLVGQNNQQMLELLDPHSPLLSLRAIQVAIRPDPETHVKIYLDSEDVSANLTTGAALWDCLWSFRSTSIYPNVGWIVLDRNVSTIRMCSAKPSCGTKTANLGLMSMVLF